MNLGAILTAILATIKELAPYVYDGILILLGKEWQRKVDEATAARQAIKDKENQLKAILDAQKASDIVDSIARHPDQLERLRDFWRKTL